MRKAFGLSVDEMLKKGTIICGDPGAVAEQIEALDRTLGIGVLNVNMKIGNISDEAVKHSMTLFGDKVIPEVRTL